VKGLRRVGSERSFRFVAFRELPAPRVALKSIAFRATFDAGVTVYADMVAMQHSRAQTTPMFFTTGEPMPDSQVDRPSRVAATRMVEAMRGR
jgi:hypothetical protein